MASGVTFTYARRRVRLAVLALLSCWCLAVLAAESQPASTVDELRRGFANPPADSRIMMRWWWFGPAVTKAELERELRVMRDGGIGGVEVQPVYPLSPDENSSGVRNLPFLSDDFIEALRFASSKARELGLRVDLTVGSGWPYGGPQVTIDQAAGKLRFERVTAAAGSAAVRVPAISPGESLIGAYLHSPGGLDNAGAFQELVEGHDGVVRLAGTATAPRDAYFFISSRTGMMVKRPAVGAEGYVLDHFSQPALTSYLRAVGDRLLQAFGPQPPHAVFCDSLEVYDSDWSSDFLDEFRRRRGYDIKPLLPALIGGAPDPKVGPAGRASVTEAVRNDWGRTLTELLTERFFVPMQQWAHEHGTRFRVQGYGTPPATLSSNAYADLPEGEGAQWKSLSASRWASSASHIYGIPVTSSETWTWLHSPVFRATPLDMKAEADLHFLQGINQLIGHGWPYTAEGVEYPGWRFYAAAVFDEKNPWWIVMPDITRYLQRLSFLLRQGSPANDVAVYLPDDDAWAHMQPGRVNLIEALRARLGPALVGRLAEAGLGFDFFDDDALRTKGGMGSEGTLRLGPDAYRAVILPAVERIPLATYQALEQFAQRGGAVIATRRVPALVPGFTANARDHEQIRAISQRLFAGNGPGRVVEDESSDLERTLTSVVTPDLSISPPLPDVGFIHRRTADAEVYFVANTSNVRQEGSATFRVSGLNAQSWDPMTGTTTAIDTRAASRGTTLHLRLEPYTSTVIVFSKGASRPRAESAGIRHETPSTIDLSTGWTVDFRGSERAVSMEQLRSWTDDAATRHFSGLATYQKDVVVPEVFIRQAGTVHLDFGEGRPVAPQPLRSGMQAWLEAPVREAAVVSVNDRRAGSVWCPPYRLDVTGLVRRGKNRIHATVANLAVNQMAGRALPDYRLLNLRYGVRFEAQDMNKIEPVPAGLLGPVRLVAIKP